MTTETASSEARTQRYRTEDVQSDAGSFTDLLLPQPLVQALAAAGFVRPSPVQKAAIPIGRVGTDLIVQAKSGTGKTAVFATILLDRVDLEVSTPQAIVLAPTRELAIQSYQVIERISAALPQPAPSAAVFVGGLPTADDTKRLRRTCHIAVGSPGRLCGLITSGALLVGKIKAVVLDEADQLLSEAFYADTAWLLQQLPKRKQVLAFSATYTPELLADLEPLMKRPQKVLLCEETVSLLGIREFYKLVGSTPSSTHEASSSSSSAASKHSTSPQQGSDSVPDTDAGPAAAPEAASSSATAAAAADGDGSELPNAASPVQGEGQGDAGQQPAEQPEQQLSIAEQQQLLSLKVDALLQLLSSVSFHQAVVFCNRKPTAEWLSRRLTAAGCPSAHLSSDLPQTERMAAMEAVRTFKVRVIVSTDVMARGVDFDRVNLVVNVDLPPDAATYVHRVGRTGRFGSRGIAIALVSQAELVKLQQHLLDVKGGDIGPVPDEVPADLYRFELSSNWEKTAYQQLLAAPTSTPPDSPPPLRKKKPSKRQQQEQEEGAAVDDSAVATSTAAAAALSAFGYDESALSCFDWDEDDAGMQQPIQQPVQQQQQAAQQQQSQMQPVGGTGQAGQQAAAAAAASAGEYDPAEAWEAWAGYYRSLGYDYPHTNPYLAGAPAAATPAEQAPASSASVQQQQQPQPPQEQQQLQQQQQQQDLPQHEVLGEVVLEELDECEEEDDEDEWELPDEDDVNDRARLLLSRLHVTQQAAALAEPTPSGPVDTLPAAAAAAAEGSSGLAAAQAQQKQQVHSCAVPSAASHHNNNQQQQQQQQEAMGEGEGVCWACWSAAYTAWQQQYTTWQQEFSAWCQQYQQQQLQQWQQYSSWCQAYQQQQLDSSQTRPSNRVD